MTDKKHKVLPERMNKVGGQAVLEGVMMKGGENVALAVRSEDGTIKLDTKKHVSVRKKYKICRIPVIRGAVNMVETFMLSYSTLEKSAEMLGIDTSEPETNIFGHDRSAHLLTGVIEAEEDGVPGRFIEASSELRWTREAPTVPN